MICRQRGLIRTMPIMNCGGVFDDADRRTAIPGRGWSCGRRRAGATDPCAVAQPAFGPAAIAVAARGCRHGVTTHAEHPGRPSAPEYESGCTVDERGSLARSARGDAAAE